LSKTIKTVSNLIDFSTPCVMGVLNLTKDSFFDGGKYISNIQIEKRIKKIYLEGAKIIDIGACSSEPGSLPIKEKEEIDKLLKAIKIIKETAPNLIISVDTFRAKVARECIKNGAHIINDISAGELDNKMFETIIELNVPYIMMHMKGNPFDMQKNPQYLNIIKEIIIFFEKKISVLNAKGFNKIIVDPGIGFGKTLQNNYQILNNIEKFKVFGYPVLIGASRKSMIYNLLNVSANEALNGTSIINTIALLKQTNILRVHDIKEAVECIKLTNMTLKSNK
jgi:dihydropteroate synthase